MKRILLLVTLFSALLAPLPSSSEGVLSDEAEFWSRIPREEKRALLRGIIIGQESLLENTRDYRECTLNYERLSKMVSICYDNRKCTYTTLKIIALAALTIKDDAAAMDYLVNFSHRVFDAVTRK